MNPICVNKIRGKFEFNPPVGAKLPVGEHILTAKFRPDDPNACIVGETVTSSITVLKAKVLLVWEPKETILYYGARKFVTTTHKL